LILIVSLSFFTSLISYFLFSLSLTWFLLARYFIEEIRQIAYYFPDAPWDQDGIILNKFGFNRQMKDLASLMSPVIQSLYETKTPLSAVLALVV
jgi:hypothetical protein